MGGTSHFLVLLGLLLVAAVPLGVILIAIGWRGTRRGAEPVCRRCGFDLTSVQFGTAGKCPECGSSLTGNVIRGGRVRRVSFLVAGLVVLLGSLGLISVGLARGGWTQLNPHKPLFVLDTEIRMNATLRDAALKEVHIRLSERRLSQSQVDRLVKHALKVQADQGRTWVKGLGDFVEVARSLGLVSDRQWHQYALAGIRPRLLATTRVTQGDEIPITLTLGPGRVGQNSQFGGIISGTDLKVDGIVDSWNRVNAMRLQSSVSTNGTSSTGMQLSSSGMAPGNHEVTVIVRRTLKSDPQVTATEEMRVTVTVLPPGESAFAFITDPQLAARATKGIRIEHLRLTELEDGLAYAAHAVKFIDFPAAAAFEIVIHFTDKGGSPKELIVGSATLERAMITGQHIATGGGTLQMTLEDLKAIMASGAVEVEMRPSLKVAKGQTNLYQVWGVPVKLRSTVEVTMKDDASRVK